MNFTAQYNEYWAEAEQAIAEFAERMNFKPPILRESMRYSLLKGGKRIRPVLFFAGLDAFGKDRLQEKAFAAALECIHTYSLIHDDLPAMDNDDFRRGKPSNHKVFGEGNAILAGDALLSYAFDLLLGISGKDPKHLLAAQCLSRAAGAEGMIAGQSADLLWTGKNGGEEELFFIYQHKTADLLAAPLVAAAILGDGDKDAVAAFGKDLGMLFQLTDDLLDVKGKADRLGKTPGKDEIENKLTCVKVFGLGRSEQIADEYAERCRVVLRVFPQNREFFEGMISLVRDRDR